MRKPWIGLLAGESFDCGFAAAQYDGLLPPTLLLSSKKMPLPGSLFPARPVWPLSRPRRGADEYAAMPESSAHYPDFLAGCLRHEPAAQWALYAHYAPTMLGVARRYASSVAEAEDILQDAFIKVFTRLGDFRAKGSLEGWIRRIVVTTAINHWQSGRGRRQQPLDELPELPSPEADVLDRLNVAEVLALIEQLPDGARLVLLLYAVEGYSHGEIAELLQIRESTSKSQLVKARRKLNLLHQRQMLYRT